MKKSKKKINDYNKKQYYFLFRQKKLDEINNQNEL